MNDRIDALHGSNKYSRLQKIFNEYKLELVLVLWPSCEHLLCLRARSRGGFDLDSSAEQLVNDVRADKTRHSSDEHGLSASERLANSTSNDRVWSHESTRRAYAHLPV